LRGDCYDDTNIRYVFISLIVLGILFALPGCSSSAQILPEREADISAAEIIERADENGTLLLTLQFEKLVEGDPNKGSEKTSTERALIKVDFNTVILKLGPFSRFTGLKNSTRDELLKKKTINVWFKSGSLIQSDPVQATAEMIVITNVLGR
jgi:hypothetical protein